MEDEILKQYQLTTLNPSSWDSCTVYSHSIADDSTLTYKQQLEDVIIDDIRNKPDLIDPIDALNPKRKIKNILHERGMNEIPNEEILKLSIGSKSFNSKIYLKLIHKDDSFNELINSLNSLEKSIEYQNNELKLLIQQEYLRFVRSKTLLDDVLNQFQKKGFVIEDDNNVLKGLKGSMNESNKETALLIKPIISSKLKEEKLVKAIEFIEKKKFFFNLSKNLKNSLQINDYDEFIRDYKKAKNLREDDNDLNNDENNKILDKIWENIELIVDSYKKNLWKLLTNDSNNDDFLKIIKKLLELGEIDNPILDWIEFKSKSLLVKFNETFNRYHDKILNVQLNILYTIDQEYYTTFKGVLTRNVQLLDYTSVIEMWLLITKLFDDIDSLIKEFIRFWNNVENFINGDYKEKLISNYVDEDSNFLNFQNYEIDDIKLKGEKFIDQIIHKLIRFFNSTQDTLKQLSHPKTESSNEFTGLIKDFGFLPPFTNSLSSLRYLPLISNKTFKILNDLGQLTITDRVTNELRETSELITERIIGSVCATWLTDCRNFYKLEDWTRLPSGETSIPNLIYDFENFILEKIGGLLFESVPNSNNDISIVRYPKKKFLNGIQTQFLRSFDILLESIIKKIIEETHNDRISKNVKNFHKLLTYFNLKKLKNIIIPKIILKFDKIFDTNLSKENLEIYSILDKLEKTIFDSYMNEQKKIITSIFKSISTIDWANNDKTLKVSSYLYKAINSLISVYIGVLSVSQDLIESVFHHLLEHSTSVMLNSFREITSFNDDGFKQAVLDIEFFKSLIGKSSTDEINNNFKLIYKNFNSLQLDIKGAYDSIGDVLDEALRCSSLEYEIFNT